MAKWMCFSYWLYLDKRVFFLFLFLYKNSRFSAKIAQKLLIKDIFAPSPSILTTSFENNFLIMWTSQTNLTFPDLSPVASVLPSGLMRRHLTPVLRDSLLLSRMFFIAAKKISESQLKTLTEQYQEKCLMLRSH